MHPASPAHAVLYADINLRPTEADYARIQAPLEGSDKRREDAWTIRPGLPAHAPTLRRFDRRYTPEPISCDCFFVRQSLRSHVQNIRVDTQTQQPGPSLC